jgi:hypothetical protein
MYDESYDDIITQGGERRSDHCMDRSESVDRSSVGRGVAWRGVAWRGVAWRGTGDAHHGGGWSCPLRYVSLHACGRGLFEIGRLSLSLPPPSPCARRGEWCFWWLKTGVDGR